MKKKRVEKGQYGYRNYHKKQELVKIFLGGAAILLQLGLRVLVSQESFKNILMVMAIVSVLPLANAAAPFLAALPYRTPGEEFHQKIRPYEARMTVLYDLILTSKELVMPMDSAAIHPQAVIFYCSNPKIQAEKAEKFLNEMFRSHRLDPNAKVFTEESLFLKRISSLKPADEYEDDGSTEYAVKLLKNLSM